jgi:hypothetical protein
MDCSPKKARYSFAGTYLMATPSRLRFRKNKKADRAEHHWNLVLGSVGLLFS